MELHYIKNSKMNMDIDFYVPSIDTAIQVAFSIDEVIKESKEVGNLIKFFEKVLKAN